MTGSRYSPGIVTITRDAGLRVFNEYGEEICQVPPHKDFLNWGLQMAEVGRLEIEKQLGKD